MDQERELSPNLLVATAVAQRPLSPHLQTYRLPWTGWLSISHRFTGVLLSLGAVMLLSIPIAVVSGPAAFQRLHDSLATFGGRALLWFWIFAFIFHLCHGVRHLLWDVGIGYSKERLGRNAALELAACLAVTVLVWLGSYVTS